MSVSGTPVPTYYDGFPKAHPSLPPSTRRSGRGGVQRRTRVDYRRSRPTSSQRVVGRLGARNLFRPRTREPRPSSPRSDRERRGEGGRGGWGLGEPVVVRQDRRTGNRQAGGGPDSPIGFPKAPPAPPARGIGGDWVAPVSN